MIKAISTALLLALAAPVSAELLTDGDFESATPLTPAGNFTISSNLNKWLMLSPDNYSKQLGGPAGAADTYAQHSTDGSGSDKRLVQLIDASALLSGQELKLTFDYIYAQSQNSQFNPKARVSLIGIKFDRIYTMFGGAGVDGIFNASGDYGVAAPDALLAQTPDLPYSPTWSQGNMLPATLADTYAYIGVVVTSGCFQPNETTQCDEFRGVDNVSLIAVRRELSVDKSFDLNDDNDGSGDISKDDVLHYSVTATNAGNVDLFNVVVSDSLITPNSITCPGPVAPGGTCQLVGTYTVTANDVVVGAINNIGEAVADQTERASDPEAVLVPRPELRVEKTFDGYDDEDGSGDRTVGDVLHYTIIATSTGTANLTNVMVSDNLNGDNTTCALLTPSQTCTLNVSYVVKPADVVAGEVVNIGTATSVQADPVQDTATVDVNRLLMNDRQPGSALVYPLFDVNNVPGNARATTIKLSNLGDGSVWVHLVRVCGGIKSFGAKGLCQASNRQVKLTPGETFVRDVASFFSVDRDNCPTGYIVAYAQKGETDKLPIVWNHLIGSVHMNSSGSLNQRTAGMQAYALQGSNSPTREIGWVNGSPVAYIEGGQGGVQPVLPFDGIGYAAPATSYSTDYLASIGQRYTDLVLLTLDVEAGFQNEPTVVALDAWNQKEEYHSGAIEYVCHVKVRLDDEINAAQPGAGVQGGMGFGKASNLGSSYGLLQMTPLTKGHAILGATVEMGGNRQTLRGLWHDAEPRPTTFYAR